MLNRRACAACAALAATLALGGCLMFGSQRSAGGILVLEVPAAASGGESSDTAERSGEMTVGERLEVRLGAFAGTGYSWTLAGPIPANMQMTTADPAGSTAPAAGTEGRAGGPTWTVFGMNAVAQGEAQLRFALVRPWENDAKVPPAREVEVTVKVRRRD